MAARVQLGASFSVRAKAKKLVTTGVYSRIRNRFMCSARCFWWGLGDCVGEMAAAGADRGADAGADRSGAEEEAVLRERLARSM